MTSASPVTMTSTIHTSDINGSISDSSIVASLQFDCDFSGMFDFSAYSVDIGSMDAYMYMPLEEFCPEIDFFNDDIGPAKVLSLGCASGTRGSPVGLFNPTRGYPTHGSGY
jgi:hypothetical protein